MSYATVQQLDEQALPPDVQNAATDAEKQAVLDTAHGVINGYLQQAGYTTPLATAGGDVLEAEVAMAAWRLASSLGLAPEGGEHSNAYLRNSDAVEWLKGVAAGRIRPVGVEDAQTGSAYTPPTVTSKEPRGW